MLNKVFYLIKMKRLQSRRKGSPCSTPGWGWEQMGLGGGGWPTGMGISQACVTRHSQRCQASGSKDRIRIKPMGTEYKLMWEDVLLGFKFGCSKRNFYLTNGSIILLQRNPGRFSGTGFLVSETLLPSILWYCQPPLSFHLIIQGDCSSAYVLVKEKDGRGRKGNTLFHWGHNLKVMRISLCTPYWLKFGHNTHSVQGSLENVVFCRSTICPTDDPIYIKLGENLCWGTISPEG